MTQTDRASDAAATRGNDAAGIDANGGAPGLYEPEMTARQTAQPSAETSRADVARDSSGATWPPKRADDARDSAMHTTYRGVLISVTATQNERGAWLAQISAAREGQPLALPQAEPPTAEWLTESEALRAGIERGRFLIDRSAPPADSLDPSPNPVPGK
jgi:hypothetical protein